VGAAFNWATHRGAEMKKTFSLAAVVIFAAVCAQAGDKTQTGTIISENSVSCGSKVEKSKQTDLLCQEYVVRTATTDYHIRQMKPVEKELIPINTPIEFSGKSYEYIVVS
jgi:hypothetical protein